MATEKGQSHNNIIICCSALSAFKVNESKSKSISLSTVVVVLVLVVHPSSLPCLVYPFPVFLFPFRTNVSVFCFSSSYRRPTLVCTLTPVPLSEHRDGRLTTRTLVNRTSDDETPSSYQHAPHSSHPRMKKNVLCSCAATLAGSSFHHMYVGIGNKSVRSICPAQSRSLHQGLFVTY